MFKLDLQSRLPIYEQLKNKICELAMIGELKPNDQLPSVRNFARDLGVNPNTVQKAYQELERQGIIYSVTGKGSFLSADAELDTQLQAQYLSKVSQATLQAKHVGVSRERVLQAVEEVYGEENKDDSR